MSTISLSDGLAPADDVVAQAGRNKSSSTPNSQQ
jgi:hypothetical protein